MFPGTTITPGKMVWANLSVAVPTLFLPQRTYSETNARETTNSTKNAFWYSGLGVEDEHPDSTLSSEPLQFENKIHS